ncbi:MAG: class I adenylate-forming enzyme family protein [Hyphomicrobiaceae bacterium]
MKLGNVLAANAGRFPDQVAAICQDRKITFGELDERANRLANALHARGVKIGDRIVINLPNGLELVEAMAGVLKSGAVMVPLSTRLTANEVAYIVSDCEPAAMIYTEDLRPQAAVALESMPGALRLIVGAAVEGEETFKAFVESGASQPPPALSIATDDCVIGYTSGTTGRPKGAVSTHANIIVAHGFMNALEWELTQRDVILATTPMAHRTGLGRLANMFYLGCRVVMQPRFDAAEAVDLIEREKVTVIGGVPTIVRMLLPEFEKRPDVGKSLRLIVATGEVFPVPLKQRLRQRLPHVGLYSFLAQTESGFVAGLRPDEQLKKPAALGRPVPGVEVRLADVAGNEVAKGEAGEILVRCGQPGHGTVMREYFRNPEATKASFVGEWFRTGDVGYFDDDGFLYFADRAKDMIVTGGLNVYSKEVELTLQEHAAVEDAAVIGMPDDEFGESVVACIVLRKGQEASAEDLIEHCRRRIASYKKPKHVHFISELPRNATGKVVKPELKRRFAQQYVKA